VKMTRDWLVWTCCSVLLPACFAGCGNKLASVNGIVRLDGKPVAVAGIAFHPVQGGTVASSATDADGRYNLVSGSRAGVAPGEYRVTIVKDQVVGQIAGVVKQGPAEAVPVMPNFPQNMRIKPLIPTQYSHPAKTPLHITVKPGSQTCDFDLTSTPGT
jgi:hypothetical protein